jgi:hypothetical protein
LALTTPTAILGISLFHFAIATQMLNAMILPLALYYLSKLASSWKLMGHYSNNAFQRYFTAAASVFIVIASAFTVAAVIFKWGENASLPGRQADLWTACSRVPCLRVSVLVLPRSKFALLSDAQSVYAKVLQRALRFLHVSSHSRRVSVLISPLSQPA